MGRDMLLVAALLTIVFCAGLAFAATSDTVSVNASVALGTSNLDIIQTTLGFGTVTPKQADHRFAAGPITVTYFAANSPWTIRAYTNNHPGAETPPATDAQFAGLKGADGTSYMALKIWNINFGGTRVGGLPYPDPELSQNWSYGTTTSPVWLRIPEKDEHTAVPSTWRMLAKAGAGLPSPFFNYVAFDAQGVKPQAYSTILYVEIINQ